MTTDLWSQSEFGSKKVGRHRLSEDNNRGKGPLQKGPPGPGGGGGDGDPIPINGGLVLLAGLSAAYLYKQKTKKQ
ncbi:MAG: hypothetical protein PHU27_07465 [Salinivirgaceae bacterium]|nr:hypothetical protein [Salinivirgaceae bacterium]MDD4746156.1 hypothetical protein [Salinivirgaceae bacterium]MDY0279932.1 hypothetical protein [Salinivirgaceae bacterium]